MKWVTSISNPEISKLLQDLLFKKYPSTKTIGYRDQYASGPITVIGFSDFRSSDILEWTASLEGINHKVFDDYEKVSLEEAIKRLSPPSKFYCDVNQETTHLLQKLSFEKNFRWLAFGKVVSWLETGNLLFDVEDKTLYIAGTKGYQKVSVDEAISLLGEIV